MPDSGQKGQPPEVILRASEHELELAVRWRAPTRIIGLTHPTPPRRQPAFRREDLCDSCAGEVGGGEPTRNPSPEIFNSTEPSPPPYSECNNNDIDQQIPPADMAASGAQPPTEASKPATPTTAAEPPDESLDHEGFASSAGPSRHVAHDIAPGADFRLLSASRVSRLPLLFLGLLFLVESTYCEATTSQIRNGIILIEGDHHPLQINAVTERFDLRPLTEASKSMERLVEVADSLDQPSVHPLLSANTACPTFGGKQALQNPAAMQKLAYESEMRGQAYSSHIPVQHEGSHGKPPVIAWTRASRTESNRYLGCAYALQPSMLFAPSMAPATWHYKQQEAIWIHYANLISRTCTNSEIRWGILKYNSRRVALPYKGSTNVFLCMEMCQAAQAAARMRLTAYSNCTGADCAIARAGCNHYSFSFGEGEESCYLYPAKKIQEEDLKNDWGDSSIRGVTAARRCVHPDLRGELYMGGPDENLLNVRQTCEFVPDPPELDVHVVCSTAASALRAWVQPLQLQLETTFKGLEGWSPLMSRYPQALPSSRAPAQAGRALATLTSSPQVTAFMGRALMQLSRLAPALPLVGPIISSGLLLASQILPRALHLCLEAWNDPRSHVLHTAYNQGTRNVHYYGNGISPWKQYNKTNLLMLKPTPTAEKSPPDLSFEMARTAMEVRRAVSEVKALTRRSTPMLATNKAILGRRGKFGVITTVDVALGHLSRVFFFLDYATPATAFRTAILMSLDPGLPLIEGRAINSPEMAAPGNIVMQCFDSLRAQDTLPDKCFDPTKSGSARNMAVPFVNDSLVVKILGEGQIQLSCPAKHGIFYSTGAFVARISETCTVLGDGGLTVYEPPRAERSAGARGEFTILWESAPVSSSFDPPVQPRVQREVRKILREATTWTDVITYILAVVALVTTAAVGALRIGLLRLDQALQATTRRSRAELEVLVKEASAPRPPPPPTPATKKKVSFEPLREPSEGPPRSHHLIPLPFWSEAQPTKPDPIARV